LQQGLALQKHVEREGASAILFATIEIEPVTNQYIMSIIDKINQYDIVIFLSQNAVAYLASLCQHINCLTPLVASIGPATSSALARYQIPVDLMPSHYDSEHLASLLQQQDLTDKKILIISGEGGRVYLENQLKSSGAYVDKIAVYRRICPPVSKVFIEKVVQIKNSVLIITSCESFENLFEICKTNAAQEWLSRVRMVVVSQRIKCFIESRGFKPSNLLVAENATDRAILDTLIKWYANTKKGCLLARNGLV
jgi:uroporphyrinogen-III synthase